MESSVRISILTIVGLLLSGIGQSFAKLERFETARLTQTAGAGVASVLINESTILNPAAITFFKDSTLYYQKTTTELVDKDSTRAGSYKEGLSEFYSISDTTSAAKGSFSYLYQNDQSGKKKKISLSSAAPVAKNTALGFILSHNEEESDVEDGEYTQIDIGLLHIISERLTLGFVYHDPQRIAPDYSFYSLGIQFQFNEYFTAMGDVGSGDVANPSKQGFNRFAFQISASKRLFLRYGISHDKLTGLKTNGYGLSWVGPKFAIELARKSSERIPGGSSLLIGGETNETTSLGLTGFF